ncbi:MAG: hypothetical protein AABZ58_06905 [Chloroflexota bacterium]
MPTFAELLARFSFLASTPASVGVVITAGLIVIFFDWRMLVLAFSAQAVLAGLLYSQLLPPQVAGIKMMVGLLIAVQMYMTGRQIDANRANGADADSSGDERKPVARPRHRFTTGLPFRIVVAVMVMLLSWQASLSPSFALPDVSPTVTLAVIGLIAMGLLGLGLTEEPLKAGLLLITGLTGFELYYAAVEPALAVIALLAAMNFAVSLAACYLAVIRNLPNRGQAR